MALRKHYRALIKILIFGFVVGLFGFLYCLIEGALIGPLDAYPVTGNPYAFKSSTIITTSGSFILGLIFGTFEVFLLTNFYKRGSFLKRLLVKVLFYVVAMNLFFIVGTMGGSSAAAQTPFFDERNVQAVFQFYDNFAYIAISLYSITAIFIALFFLEASEYLGVQIAWNFLIGKYYTPHQDERIFMFLDMKSSTTIAERMGHKRYFELLEAYYKTMTNAIVNAKGEVYQYVGDEIIVSWDIRDGLENNNFLECFFGIKTAFNHESSKFMEKYGLVPEFKAGIHYGEVTSGEIGELKKEVLFTGDPLNATSRIQGLCKKYDVDVLISADLLDKITLPDHLEKIEIGDCELRGKDKKVKLYSVLRKG